MSEPPPPPLVSPDRRFYWDGERWVPTEQGSQIPQPGTVVKQPRSSVGCVTHTTCLTLVAIFGGLALVLLIAGVCSSIASNH